ncbi:MAG: hypothetical protein J5986_11995 [Roseburia sp.]|nr:hypothetical protein [Roseburia sp.]
MMWIGKIYEIERERVPSACRATCAAFLRYITVARTYALKKRECKANVI